MTQNAVRNSNRIRFTNALIGIGLKREQEQCFYLFRGFYSNQFKRDTKQFPEINLNSAIKKQPHCFCIHDFYIVIY